MPYVAPEVRNALDGQIDSLAKEMKALCREPASFAGILNYAATRLALSMIEDEPVRYWKIATVSGVFHNAADEFYRRFAAPYEDRQIAQNGDVYPES